MTWLPVTPLTSFLTIFPLTQSTLATRASLPLFLEHGKYIPALEPLHPLPPLAGTLCPQIAT